MADYFSNFVEYFPRLMEGLKLTIIIAIFGILLAVALGIIPVSYTHLDVYKRQKQNSATQAV